MRIAIDLRCLQGGEFTGVENYTLNLLDQMLAMDKKNSYTLFFNSFFGKLPGEFHYINSKTKFTRFPNRFLNLAFKLRLAEFEKLAGSADWVFMPNPNQINLSSGTKLALTVHDLSLIVTPGFYNLKRRLWHKFLNLKKLCQRATVIFSVSEYTKLDLVRLLGVPESKIFITRPGPGAGFSSFAETENELRQTRNFYGLPGDYILFLSTVEPRKNLLGLLKAFEFLKSPVNLVIAGKWGWKNFKLAQAIKRSPKFQKIKYLGYLPEKDKALVIKMAKVLVYPSFYEGFGFQPLEAFCLGVPVIAGSAAAIPEIAQGAALLVNPFNIADLSNALNEVLTNDRLRHQLISRGLMNASRFSWKTAAQETLNILNSL